MSWGLIQGWPPTAGLSLQLIVDERRQNRGIVEPAPPAIGGEGFQIGLALRPSKALKGASVRDRRIHERRLGTRQLNVDFAGMSLLGSLSRRLAFYRAHPPYQQHLLH